jgi:hypothetical protein
MSNILKTLAAGSVSGEYQISRSLRFNSADSAYLSRTPASAGSRTTWTFSCWLKRSATSITSPEILGAATSGQDGLRFNGTTNRLQFFSYVSAPSNQADLITTQVFRDYSAWYNIVAVWDTENATSTDRVRIYINGSRVSDFDTEVYPGPSATSEINNNVLTQIGVTPTASNYLDGYLADIYFIDGAALTADSFGEVNEETGVWTPIKFSGTYGTNGFYLPFSDNSDVTAATLGADYSGNGNNWTPSGSPGFSVTAGAGNDSLVDTPTQYGDDTGAGGEVRGNYCTWNPLDKSANGTAYSLVNGNLDANSDSTQWENLRATMGMTTGKWYWEVTITSNTPYNDVMVGVVTTDTPLSTRFYQSLYGYFWRCTDDVNDVAKWNNNTSAAYGTTVDLNDVVGVAFNADNGELTFYKNGSSQGIAYTVTTGLIYAPALNGNGNRGSVITNFGQRPFAYTAPSGFKALVTTNLPEPTVVQGDDYFNTVLYTANDSTLAVTGVGFQPDLTWFKIRSSSGSPVLFDAVRGHTLALATNQTVAELAAPADTDLVSFDADGFTLGPSNDTWASIQETVGTTHVVWNWKANGAGVSNGDGTISSTVSVSTTSGFSIVTYTGTGSAGTVGHSLGSAPKMIILKGRTNTDQWFIWHNTFTSSQYIYFNTTDVVSGANPWNNTLPTDTLFSLGTDGGVNGNTTTYVAYCFAEVESFSKFGSYTGNGSADGPFVYTGFRPAFVLGKDSSSTNNWFIFDSVRDTYNVAGKILRPNLSDAELDSPPRIDLLSNGFKVRSTALPNDSGVTYIYMAFAENPFKNSLAR